MSAELKEVAKELHQHEQDRLLRGFKGVRRRKWGRWVSEIRVPKSRSRIWLGSYDSAEKAARAYDAAVYCLRGTEAAGFNFPVDRIKPQLTDEQRLALSLAEVKEIANAYACSLAAAPTTAENEVGKGEMDALVVGACRSVNSTSPAAADVESQWDYSFESLVMWGGDTMGEVISTWDLL